MQIVKESKFKKLETAFAWAEFYSNSKNLETQTRPNQEAFNKVQKEIIKLKKELID